MANVYIYLANGFKTHVVQDLNEINYFREQGRGYRRASFFNNQQNIINQKFKLNKFSLEIKMSMIYQKLFLFITYINTIKTTLDLYFDLYQAFKQHGLT